MFLKHNTITKVLLTNIKKQKTKTTFIRLSKIHQKI